VANKPVHIRNIQMALVALAPLFLLWKYLGFPATAALTVLTVPLWSPLLYLLIAEWLPCCSRQTVFLCYLGSLVLLIACQNVRLLSSYRLLAFAVFWTLLGFHLGYDLYTFIRTKVQSALQGPKRH
jgi:hypothetical protein